MPINHPEIPEGELIDGDNYRENHVITNLLGYELIEEKTLPAGTTTCTFSNLNGDEDVKYFITGEINIVSNGADRYLTLQPNGITTNQTNKYHSSYKDTTAYLEHLVDRGGAVLFLTQSGWSSNSFNIFSAEFYVKTGHIRLLKTSSSVFVSTTQFMVQTVDSYWDNSITNIESLTLSLTSGGSMSGTIKLWKVI
jgi:hypothetical protein